MGRHTYGVEDRVRSGIYGGAWSGPYFVLTHEPPAVVSDWMTGTFINEDIERAVARAKEAAGDKNVGILGAADPGDAQRTTRGSPLRVSDQERANEDR